VIDRLIQDRKTAQSHAQHAAPQRTIEEAMKGNKNAVKDKDVPSVIPFTLEGDIDERNSFDNVKTVSVAGGNSAEYLTSRIARDRPDILDRMKAGNFPQRAGGGEGYPACRSSAHQARICATPLARCLLTVLWSRPRQRPVSRRDRPRRSVRKSTP